MQQISDSDKRCIALSRTLLFNYGQGIWTPLNVYLDCCVLIDVSPKLSSLPDLKPLEIPLSFFSKKYPSDFCKNFQSMFMLYEKCREENLFLSLPSVTKLCWLRNFTYMQELLFNFSTAELQKVTYFLWKWKRPPYLIDRIPFQHKVLAIEDV